jgi:hypothetical protein
MRTDLVQGTRITIVNNRELAGDWIQEPVNDDAPSLHSNTPFAKRLLRDLHSLNREYLSLLAGSDCRSSAIDSEQALPDTVARSLIRLSEPERAAISRCPYALFDLALEDAQRWRHILMLKQSRVRAEPRVGEAQMLEFVRTALFVAWHAVQIDITFARFSFGMHPESASRLAGLSVGSMTVAASHAVEWLGPRWSNNACFWPDLIRFAASDAVTQFQASKLLGCQLLASNNKATFIGKRGSLAAATRRK